MRTRRSAPMAPPNTTPAVPSAPMPVAAGDAEPSPASRQLRPNAESRVPGPDGKRANSPTAGRDPKIRSRVPNTSTTMTATTA